jgi:N utilization substance protein A
LIGYDIEVQRMSDYNRTRAIQRSELASSDDPTLDEPLQKIEGINKLLFEHLVQEGFATPRKLLMSSPEELSKVPGISIDMADHILEQIRKQRM